MWLEFRRVLFRSSIIRAPNIGTIVMHDRTLRAVIYHLSVFGAGIRALENDVYLVSTFGLSPVVSSTAGAAGGVTVDGPIAAGVVIYLPLLF